MADEGLPFRLMLVIVYALVAGAWEMFEAIIFLLEASFFNPANNPIPIGRATTAALFGALLLVSGVLMVKLSYWARYATLLALFASAAFDADPALRGFLDAQVLVALHAVAFLILLFTKKPFVTEDRSEELAQGSGTNFGVR